MNAGAMVLLAALMPAPQPGPDDAGVRAGAEFVHLRDNAIELLRGSLPAASAERLERALGDERAEAQTRELGFQRVSALDPTASSAVDRATLGVGTSVDGAEAGLSLSPAALAGSTNPKAVAFNVFLGALKADEARVGMRYTWERSGQLDPSGLPDECPFEESRSRAWLDSIANEYRDVCRVVSMASAAPSGVAEADWAVARAACGIPGAAYPEPEEGNRNLRVVLIVLPGVARALRSSVQDEVAREARATASAAEELAAFDPTRSLDCFGTEKALAERFRVEQWRTGTTRFGFSTHVDVFARRFGFSPDGKDLPGGEVKAWQSRIDFSRQRGRGQWTAGGGVGVARQDFKGDYSVTLTPAVSASYIAFSLTGRSLLEPKEVEPGVTVDVMRIEDGKFAPHVVIGFLAKAEIVPSPPDTQTTHFNSFEAQAFMDFKIRENLSFRLGVPLRAELKTRAADAKATPPLMKQSSLQWSVPVAIVTVIKL